MIMNYDDILKNIRLLINDLPPEQDISDILLKHHCSYLIKKQNNKLIETINKICINERFTTCQKIFEAFHKYQIPYAVIKGAVLSQMAYDDPFCRQSSDIDLIIDRRDLETVKQILFKNRFIQGRIVQDKIIPFNRKELLFQITMSHQTAPFIKKTSNIVCPFVNVDINLDLFWGEKSQKTDMKEVLRHTEPTEICNVKTQKLTPEMEFISLCLHHYKDANSLYLLWQKSLNLSLFCDIYFYLKRNPLNIKKLKALCEQLHATDYVYYDIYYTNKIFDDTLLFPYMKELQTDTCANILNTFGLTLQEQKTWELSFYDRLFSENLQPYLKKVFNDEDMHKVRINQQLM